MLSGREVQGGPGGALDVPQTPGTRGPDQATSSLGGGPSRQGERSRGWEGRAGSGVRREQVRGEKGEQVQGVRRESRSRSEKGVGPG